MNSAAMVRRMAKLLAILSVALFWLLPFSPLVAIGAVSATSDDSRWVRRVAVAGAILCVVYTVTIALLVGRLMVEVAFWI